MTSLPPGWVEATVGDVAEYINGLAFKPSDWVDEGRPIIRIQNLTSGDAAFNKTTRKVEDRYLVHGGDLLVSWSATLDAFIWHGPEAVLNQHIFKVVPNTDVVDPAFLYWAMKEVIQEMIQSEHLHGSTMKHINRGPFLSHPLRLPPLHEQRRIAAKIESLAARSRRAKEALEAVPMLLDMLRQSVLASAFRGDLTADWRKTHSGRDHAGTILASLPVEVRREWKLDGVRASDGLPPSWLRVPFGSLIRSMRSGTTLVPQDDQTSIPVLRSSSVRPGHVDLEDVRFLDPHERHSEQNFLQDNDLLFTRLSGSRDYVANCAWVRGLQGRRIQYPDRLFRAQLFDASMAPYLEACFGWATVHEEIVGRTKSTAGHQRVSIGAITEQIIPLAPLDEQREIVRRLQTIAASIELLGVQADLACGRLRELEASMLAKAFRGELVRQDPRDELASAALEQVRATRENARRGKVESRGRSRRDDVVAGTPDNNDGAALPLRRAQRDSHVTKDISELSREAVHEEVFAALWTHGPLEIDDAVRRVAEHLRAAGYVTFQRLRGGGPLYVQVLGFIESAIRDGRLDRPKRGFVRACNADATALSADDWRYALVASLGTEPADRDAAIRAAAEWARDNLGLEFARLRADGHIVEGLRSALNSAIRRGEVVRHDATRISRSETLNVGRRSSPE